MERDRGGQDGGQARGQARGKLNEYLHAVRVLGGQAKRQANLSNT